MSELDEKDNGVMALTAASTLMPRIEGVSPLIQQTYDIGAKHLALALLEGDLKTGNENTKAFAQRFLGRVFANAESKGIDLSAEQEPAKASLYEAWTEVALMAHDLDAAYSLTPAYLASHLSEPTRIWAQELPLSEDETSLSALMTNLHNARIVTAVDSERSTYRLGELGILLVDGHLAKQSSEA
jgi:hypothetical protein